MPKRTLPSTTALRPWFALLALLCTPLCQAALPDTLLSQYRQGIEHWPVFEVDEGVTAEELGPLPALEKPSWQNAEVEALGKMLFFDPRLSGSGQIACASCHDPQLAWGDGRRSGIGHDRQLGDRNTMTILNSGYFQRHFWDGRAQGLEAQALQPIINPIEMNADLNDVIARLQEIAGYRQTFTRAFGSPGIDADRLAQALAAFQRTVVSRPNRLDRFIAGQTELLTDQQIEGLHLFRTQARCMNCHSGPLLSDGQFHNIGLTYYGRQFEDFGLQKVTRKTEDQGKFRTPSLRDVLYTGPWMHNGLLTNLRGILNLYNQGMIGNRALQAGEKPPSPLLKRLSLDSEQLLALHSFLEAISQPPGWVSPPILPSLHLPELAIEHPLESDGE